MNKLNLLHSFDYKNNLSNYSNDFRNEKNNNLANLINKNFNKLSKEEKNRFLIKCLSEEEVNNLLLKFELENYSPNKSDINSFEEFIKIASKSLNRYQSKAGGFLIEDNEWIIHRNNSKDYEIENNQVVFENSVSIENVKDYDTINYLKKILSLLKRFSDKVIVCEEFIKSKKDGVYWILFKCEYKV